MNAKWPAIPLADIASNFDSRRVPLSSRERQVRPGPYPYYGATGIMDYIDDYLFDGLYVLIAEDGSIERPDGRPFVQLVDGRFWVSNHAHVVQAQSKTDTKYLYFALSSINIRPYMTGSVQAKLSQANMNRIMIYWPNEMERAKIVNILSTLDDKIDLNRRMNETLEQMARAIFKSWFVDFEPVRAKMSGRWKKGESLPGLPAHLWDLFPDRLVPSELGDIPEGWIIGTIKDVLSELVTGARPKGGAVLSGVPSIGAENIIGLGHYDYSKEKYIPEEFFKQLESRRANVQNGDVLLYKDGAYIGRKTYFDCSFPHKKCAINEHVFILRTKNRWVQRYLFLWLDLPAITQEIVALNSNSAQPGINQAGVNGLPLLQPLDEIVNEFDQIVKPIFDRIFKNCLESLSLSLVRDALLPKLIGEAIQLNDIGELMENRK